jgi:alpha-L-glutamate ligase-like protein
MLKWLKKSKGILGMNARNQHYIRPENPRSAIRLADDKLRAKKILKRADIPVPKTYAIIENYEQLLNFNWNSLPKTFVLKPNRGFGGEGILIVYGRKKNNAWVKANGQEVVTEDLFKHISNILDGHFSLAHIPGLAFFEERIKILKLFKPFCFRGIPDIRIIVYNKVPVIAMLRLPTEESGGRANLHLGGIGVGIDIGTGITTTAIWHNKLIEYVPGTRLLLKGIQIPHWQQILRMAVKSQLVSKLGYLGVDIAIYRE